MNTHQGNGVDLPVKGKLRLIYVISFLIAALVAVVSIAGLRYRAFIYPTEELMRTFVSNDVVNLLIGLPILLGSMWLAWRGKLIGLLCWAGALFFMLYSYLTYVFAVPLNWAFLAHLTLVMLSAYTLIGLVARLDGNVIRQRLAGAVPEKLSGGVLAGFGILYSLRVIVMIVSALAGGKLIAETELAVSIADFLITPAWIVGGILLWQHKDFGYVTGLGLLFQGSMLFIAVIIVMFLQPVLSAAPLVLADILVVALMGLIFFVPFALFARGVVAKQA